MADEAENKPAEEPKKKGKLGLIIALVGGAVVLIGGTLAVVLLVLPGASAPAEAAPEGEAAAEEAKKADGDADEADGEEEAKADKPKPDKASAGAPSNIVSVSIPAVVVDLRDEDDRVRHLKAGLAAELPDDVTPDDFKLVIPRAREAAVSYLRSLSFEEVSDPKKYPEIKETLSSAVVNAVGPERVHRVLLVDFVAQ